MIKAKDHLLHLINVAVPGFLNPDLALEGVLQVKPFFQYTAEDEATPSQPTTKEEEEEEEEVVKVFDSEDNFEVINQRHSPEALISDFSHLPLA